MVAPDEDAIYNPLGVVGPNPLPLHYHWNAPNGRIVAATVGDTSRTGWRDVVPAGENAISESIRRRRPDRDRVPGGCPEQAQSLRSEGRTTGRGEAAGAGNRRGVERQERRDRFLLRVQLLPPSDHDLSLRPEGGHTLPFHAAATPFDASAYETRAAFYQSKDGTKVPIFITARKGITLDGSHPTLLYGYGGFNVSIQPFYSPASAAWIELGGVYAVANLRGGSEYGEAWHHAGMRDKKQNVFDDFIAAAEFLIHEGYTTPQNLAIQGGSNGGLLVGAAMTQRPDLFGVALPAVGVMDMLRYQDFTGGRFWAEEYGSSEDSTAVGYLLAYSPLHNIKPGTCYPATLVTTADHDDRVVPSHSFKFAATLQAAQACARSRPSFGSRPREVTAIVRPTGSSPRSPMSSPSRWPIWATAHPEPSRHHAHAAGLRSAEQGSGRQHQRPAGAS